MKLYLVKILGIGLSLFIIFTILRGQFSVPLQRGTILMLGTVIIFLSRPGSAFLKSRFARLDELLSWLGIAAIIGSVFYIYVEWFEIAEYRPGAPTVYDLLIYSVTILVVFEITRRTSGMVIPLVAIFFIAYLLLGQYLPGIFHHSSIPISEIIEGSFGLTGEGIYGLVLSVMVGIIYIFIIYGAFLRVSGAGDVFVKLAYMTAGRIHGGAAQTAVVSSALFGSISGSPPANVMATGTFTIPLMIQVGYRPVFAGAVEACASTVGQVMPPVMGVGAFIMAEITGIPYLRICLASLLPAILFSFSISVSVFLEAKKKKIGIIPREKIPVFDIALIRQTTILGFSLGTLVFMLIKGYSPAFSCLSGIGALILGSFFDRKMRMTPFKILEALSKGAQDGLSLLAICAILGIVINAINSTGIGLSFSQLITFVARDNLMGALLLTMCAAIILGMGLPTVPAYLMVILVAGMALGKMGINLLQMHLFVFYYAILCTITPPVAISAYAAANISKANPMQTGFIAWRLGLVGFIIPFIMIFNPEISFHAESFWSVPRIFLFSAAGVYALAAFDRNFLIHSCSLPSRILLLIAALALFYPLLWVKIMGLAGLMGLIYLQKKYRA
ncbi:MAG: TRAP transporter fused permease subunit [Deltaproteobacteria bacterium]|nr:TRAP transporter fused permease subunit [Deltaproteobacteria bacterium]